MFDTKHKVDFFIDKLAQAFLSNKKSDTTKHAIGLNATLNNWPVHFGQKFEWNVCHLYNNNNNNNNNYTHKSPYTKCLISG